MLSQTHSKLIAKILCPIYPTLAVWPGRFLITFYLVTSNSKTSPWPFPTPNWAPC